MEKKRRENFPNRWRKNGSDGLSTKWPLKEAPPPPSPSYSRPGVCERGLSLGLKG
jgi:hypothetical protein